MGRGLLAMSLGLMLGLIACDTDDVRKQYPMIELDPVDELNFGVVSIAATKVRTVKVMNPAGRVPLILTDVYIQEGSAPYFAVADILTETAPGAGLQSILEESVWSIPAGSYAEVRVSFGPRAPEPFEGTLIIVSDATNATDGGEVVALVGAGSESELPEIKVNPPDLDFAADAYGGVGVETLEIENVGEGDLIVEEIVFGEDTSPEFRFISSNHGRATVPPGAKGSIRIGYEPEHEDDVGSGTMFITSNDPERPLVEVPLSAFANLPPVAIASADRYHAVPFDAAIQLDGSESYDPDDNTPLSYAWNFIDRPSGSTSAISGAADERAAFQPDAAGTYMVELIVTDAVGLQNLEEDVADPCDAQNIICVEVVPPQDLHIQLSWDHPSSDVDLHLIRPPAAMWSSSEDCYFSNCKAEVLSDGSLIRNTRAPDWGIPGQVSDDPSLDYDDVNGYGPENINIISPANETYRIAIHYYSAHGVYDPSTTATVRVFAIGTLVAEFQQFLQYDDLAWDVCDVRWPVLDPNEDIMPLGSVYSMTPPGGSYP